MSQMKKTHKILSDIIPMSDIATELVSVYPLILNNSKNQGCVLKYKKAYDPKNITHNIAEALNTIVKEKEDIVEERFLDVNIPWDISIISNKYVEKNFSICLDKEARCIYIDYEK